MEATKKREDLSDERFNATFPRCKNCKHCLNDHYARGSRRNKCIDPQGWSGGEAVFNDDICAHFDHKQSIKDKWIKKD